VDGEVAHLGRDGGGFEEFDVPISAFDTRFVLLSKWEPPIVPLQGVIERDRQSGDIAFRPSKQLGD